MDVNHPNKEDESGRAAEQTEIQDDPGGVGDERFNEPLSERFSFKLRIKILMQDSFI